MILVIGGTGTLGRQIVKQLLILGLPVKCLVRNVRKATFLKEWGATLVYGDLKLPETIPNSLKGVNVIIDASTLRPEEELATIKEVDLIGKLCLIKAAEVANIKKVVFFSIINNEKHPTIPLMRLKKKVEDTLKLSKLSYTTYQISGFYQGLIGQYAIPILEQQVIYTTQDSSFISYIDTRDIAKHCAQMLLCDHLLKNKKENTIKLTDKNNWNSKTIISLCEELSGQSAKIKFIPLLFLSTIKNLMLFSKWTWEIHDRLAFSEVLSNKLNSQENNTINASFYSNTSNLIDEKFSIQQQNLKNLSLEIYFEDYFENILKKLRDLNYDQNQIAKRKDLTF